MSHVSPDTPVREEETIVARVQLAPLSSMTPEQKQAYEEAAAGRRGHAPAPMIAWLKSPELARRAQKLGEFVRYETTLPPRLSELAILLTARHWTSHFEWQAHKPEGLKAGIEPDIIDAIAARRRPSLKTEEERAVYRLTTSLLETHQIPEDLYRAGVQALGERRVVELVGLLGYYALVSMTLNAFEIGLPEATAPELLER